MAVVPKGESKTASKSKAIIKRFFRKEKTKVKDAPNVVITRQRTRATAAAPCSIDEQATSPGSTNGLTKKESNGHSNSSDHFLPRKRKRPEILLEVKMQQSSETQRISEMQQCSEIRSPAHNTLPSQSSRDKRLQKRDKRRVAIYELVKNPAPHSKNVCLLEVINRNLVSQARSNNSNNSTSLVDSKNTPQVRLCRKRKQTSPRRRQSAEELAPLESLSIEMARRRIDPKQRVEVKHICLLDLLRRSPKSSRRSKASTAFNTPPMPNQSPRKRKQALPKKLNPVEKVLLAKKQRGRKKKGRPSKNK